MDVGNRTLKQRLYDGEILFGTFFKFNCPPLAEMLGYAGMDFIIVDGEHSDFSYGDMQNVVRAANGVGMSAVIRVPNSLDQNILHACDMGAQGVQIPNLQSPADVDAAIRQMRYYPKGNRGFAMTTRAARYSFWDREQFIRYSNEELLSVIMIENTEIARQAPAVCGIDGVDVVFIGTGDMSQSLGVPGQSGHPSVQAVMEQVVRDVRAAGKVAGIVAGDLEEAARYTRMGVQYIAYSADMTLIAQKFREVTASLRQLGHAAAGR